MDTEHKLQRRRWLVILIVALVIVALVIIVRGHFSVKRPVSPKQSQMQKKMTDIKMSKNLKQYQAISGILDIQHWETTTGAKVYFVPVPTLPMVDIELIFDAGAARNEKKGGLAYLTNAMLANGTQDMTADQVAESFDNVGAQFTAESQRDMALVHLRSLSSPEQLDPAVKTMAAILSHPVFPLDGFRRDQQNGFSAFKTQMQQPHYVASRTLFSLLYADQPYSNWVLGDGASLLTLTPEEVKNFHQKYYTAKNAVVAIVGDLSLEKAAALAEVLTKDLPQGEKAPPLAKVKPIAQKITKKIDFPSAQTTILLGELGITRDDPDYYPLVVGNHILGGNSSVNRIFNVIRNQHGLAYSAHSYFSPMRVEGPYVLSCQTRNKEADKALSLMVELFKNFIKEGPNEKELQDAKRNLIGGYALEFDSNSSICHEIAGLGFYHLPLTRFNEFKQAVDKVTAQDIKRAYEKRISPEKFVVVMVGGTPDTSGSKEAPLPPQNPSSSHTHDEDAPRGAQN